MLLTNSRRMKGGITAAADANSQPFQLAQEGSESTTDGSQCKQILLWFVTVFS